ncbi:VOC family protein [Aquipuribacter nitratireducens]|uniref:VOC family protein n=1 Tax=Aquipuribacter nitratireducens TaxID=650104 RepID=A0ABW0GJP8_9MICO
MVERMRCELFPGDLDVAVTFYVDVLGFTVERDERSSASPYVALERGTVHVGLARREEAVDVDHRRPPVGVELVLEVGDEVSDLVAARDRAVGAGWPLDEDLTARPWGLVDFRLLDPAGYYWRITTG